MITKKTRKEMEDLIYRFFNSIDPSGNNLKRYKKLIGDMDDKEFDSFFAKLFDDPKSYLILDMVSYEYEPTIEAAEATAEWMGVQLYDYLACPHMSKDPNRPFVTMRKVPIGRLHCKRVQQMARKKNTTSTNINQRDGKTNQVVGDSKNSRSSDMENFAMTTYEANYALREFLGPRADDTSMQNEMHSAIYKKGYVDIDELTVDLANKKTLNTLDVYLLCMGFKSDLISKGYVLKGTLDD